MLYFFVRGPQHRTCEVRLNPEGAGYELVVEDLDGTRIERFESLPRLCDREEVIQAQWLSEGWREPERLNRSRRSTAGVRS